MLSQNVVFLGLAAIVLADPIPLPAPQSATDLGSFATEAAAALTSQLGLLSDLPTLPASIESILSTAIPASYFTATDAACETTTPGWYKSLPSEVMTALSSYETALASYLSVYSSELGLSAGDLSFTSGYPGLCPTTAAAGATTTAAVNGVTSTGKTTATPTASGTSSGSKSNSTSSSTTSTVTAGSAPGPRGAMIVSFAGFAGLLGLMAAL
jgi:hypothetical protein